MSDDRTGFPDISDILARKAEGRRKNARLSFGEKIAMMEALRERLEPFKRAREARRAKRNSGSSSPAKAGDPVNSDGSDKN